MTTGGATTSVAARGDTAHVRPRTAGRRPVPLLAGLTVVVLAATWLALGTHPRVEVTGASWADPRLVEWPDQAVVDDDPLGTGGTWVVWDSDDGAAVSVEVRNRQPYPVTVAPGEPAPPGVAVRLARDARPGRLAPEDLVLGDRVVVGPGESFVVSVLLADECLALAADTAAGTGRAPIDVVGLGLHATVEVPLPATYLVGRTADHRPAASCP